jgi:hypothetical protein
MFYNLLLQSQGTKNSFCILLTNPNNYFKVACLLFFIVFNSMFVVSSTPTFSGMLFNADKSLSFPYKKSFLFYRAVHLEQHFGIDFKGCL